MDNITLDKLYKLININITINDDYDNFDVVLQRLLHAIEIITNSETTSLLVYDINKKDLIFRFATGFTSHDLMGLVVPEGKGIAHAVAKSRKGVIVNNPEEFGHYSNIDLKLNYKTKTLMAFPMLDQNGEVFGVVETCNKRSNEEYTKNDFQLLSIFCQQAERTIRHALHIHTLKKIINNLHHSLESMRATPLIHVSREMKNNMSLVRKIAISDSPITILGDKGTGKSLIAFQIHNLNHRKTRQLIEIDCYSLVNQADSSLRNIKIDLWGIDKNLKKGIQFSKTGLMQQAHNSTVLIDEVSCLPIEIQKEILDLLLHKFFKKVDGNTFIPLDIRFVFTSTQDLYTLVQEKKFLEELYFLINSLTIKLSPINSRIDDLQAITEYYMKYYNKFYRKGIKTIEPEVYVLFKRYYWKYNIHSLKDKISHLVLHCSKDVLSAEYVASHFYSLMDGYNENANVFTDDFESPDSEIITLRDAVNKFKTRYIHKALLFNNWNHTKTSELLDIQRSYLSRLVKDYDLKKKTVPKT